MKKKKRKTQTIPPHKYNNINEIFILIIKSLLFKEKSINKIYKYKSVLTPKTLIERITVSDLEKLYFKRATLKDLWCKNQDHCIAYKYYGIRLTYYYPEILMFEHCIVCEILRLNKLYYEYLKNPNQNLEKCFNTFFFEVNKIGEFDKKYCLGYNLEHNGIFKYIPIFTRELFFRAPDSNLKVNSKFINYNNKIQFNSGIRINIIYNTIDVFKLLHFRYNIDLLYEDTKEIKFQISLLQKIYWKGSKYCTQKLYLLINLLIKYYLEYKDVLFLEVLSYYSKHILLPEPLDLNKSDIYTFQPLIYEVDYLEYERTSNTKAQYTEFTSLSKDLYDSSYWDQRIWDSTKLKHKLVKSQSIWLTTIYFIFGKGCKGMDYDIIFTYLPLFYFLKMEKLTNNDTILKNWKFYYYFPKFCNGLQDYIPDDGKWIIFNIFAKFKQKKNDAITMILGYVLSTHYYGRSMYKKILNLYKNDQRIKEFFNKLIVASVFNMYNKSIDKEIKFNDLLNTFGKFMDPKKREKIENSIMLNRAWVEILIIDYLLYLCQNNDVIPRDDIKIYCTLNKKNSKLFRLIIHGKIKSKKMKTIKKYKFPINLSLYLTKTIEERFLSEFIIQNMFQPHITNRKKIIKTERLFKVPREALNKISKVFYDAGFIQSIQLLKNPPFNVPNVDKVKEILDSYTKISKEKFLLKIFTVDNYTICLLYTICKLIYKLKYVRQFKLSKFDWLEQKIKFDSSQRDLNFYYTFCCSLIKICNIESMKIKDKQKKFYKKKTGYDNMVIIPLSKDKTQDFVTSFNVRNLKCLKHFNTLLDSSSISNVLKIIKYMKPTIIFYMNNLFFGKEDTFFMYYIKFFNSGFTGNWFSELKILPEYTTINKYNLEREDYKNVGMVRKAPPNLTLKELHDIDKMKLDFIKLLHTKWKSLFKKYFHIIFKEWDHFFFKSQNDIISKEARGFYFLYAYKEKERVIRICNYCGILKEFEVFYHVKCIQCITKEKEELEKRYKKGRIKRDYIKRNKVHTKKKIYVNYNTSYNFLKIK